MRASSACVSLVTQFEQFRPTAYKPTNVDHWTIGYGHTAGVAEGMTCTTTTAIMWLHDDLCAAEDAVNAFVSVPLNQNQFDALVSFTFNEGAGHLEESTLLRKLNDGQTAAAVAEFDHWVYQNGKLLDGLVRRRAAEKALFML